MEKERYVEGKNTEQNGDVYEMGKKRTKTARARGGRWKKQIVKRRN